MRLQLYLKPLIKQLNKQFRIIASFALRRMRGCEMLLQLRASIVILVDLIDIIMLNLSLSISADELFQGSTLILKNR
jgi:hypothetical protein